MLSWFGETLYRLRGVVLLAAFVVIVAATIFGIGVFGTFTKSGVPDPTSESAKANALVASTFSTQSTDVVLLLSNNTLKATDPAFTQAATSLIATLKARSEVVSLTSYYATHNPDLLSRDGHETIVLMRISAQGGGQTSNYLAIAPLITSPLLHIEAGGFLISDIQFNDQISADLAHAESIALPIVAILLLVIFGGLVAAGLPLLIGVVSIIGSLAILRVLTSFTEVSNFAVNVVTFIGLGLAIDYSLFIVTRFREELAIDETDVRGALGRTVRSAGRTILFSGLTVITSLLGLQFFPEYVFRSIGLAAMSAALVAMVAALTILPALLAILGRRVNALSLQRVFRRLRRARRSTAQAQGFWYRLSHVVMRWPVPVIVVTLAVLLLLGSPFLHVSFSTSDERALPAGASARVVVEHLKQGFPNQGNSEMDIVIRTRGDALSPQNLAQLDRYVHQVSAIAGVTNVESLVSIDPHLALADYQRLYANPSANAQVAATATRLAHRDLTEVIVTVNAASRSLAAQAIVRLVRSLTVPTGFMPLVGGDTAQDMDLFAGLRASIPRALLVMIVAIFVLLFLMTGSLIMPLKAIILNTLSLSATCGALVWMFQDGHLHNLLGFQSIGSLDVSQIILIFALAFSLSMDYEVFLLSRIREQFDKTGENREAVALGLQRTGWLITSAALLLAVVVGAFATSKIIFIQELGIGVALAVLVDATLVRGLLLPAMMSLLGAWNWWAPRPLRAVWQRIGLKEAGEARLIAGDENLNDETLKEEEVAGRTRV
jgi:trehalose monomycolate/heme transporter